MSGIFNDQFDPDKDHIGCDHWQLERNFYTESSKIMPDHFPMWLKVSSWLFLAFIMIAIMMFFLLPDMIPEWIVDALS